MRSTEDSSVTISSEELDEIDVARRWTHERRVLLLSLLIGLPGSLVGLVLLWTGDYSLRLQWTLTVFILVFWPGAALVLRGWVVRPLRTLSNLLAALREGDFSIRARGARPDDSLGLAMLEVNSLSRTLREQRLGAVEASALLRKVMAEIEVAVFAFDGADGLQLLNKSAERLLGRSAERVVGQTADELGLADLLHGESPRTVDAAFPGASGRWELRRTTFRQEGLKHQLVVLSDLSRALREEERQAWQRLIRVLGHEINNSLAPIISLAGSLRKLIGTSEDEEELEEDLTQGLAVIAHRAEGLNRFMASYARLARLPPPQPAPLDVRDWIERVVELETRKPVVIRAGPDLVIEADGDQLDQLLINLLANAVDAAMETGGDVEVAWRRHDGRLEVLVEDEGPGIPDPHNLFVPFFTTKPHGSGVGLPLSRQIAEAHGGTLSLANRADGRGCVATLELPL